MRGPGSVLALAIVAAELSAMPAVAKDVGALRRIGDETAAPAVVAALGDKDSMVREAAANTLGHLGGDVARSALEARKAAETDARVLATIDAALGAVAKRVWASRSDGKEWKETLAGPEGARRVEWA